MKIAIIGLSPDSHDAATWDDPDWQKWGLPWDAYATWCQVLVEIHSEEFLHTARRAGPKYIERLRELDVPVYMQTLAFDIPLAREYPLADVIALTGDYFTCSPAYHMGLAILREPKEIGIWGIDLREDKYSHQIHNLDYMIGFARGRGIEVNVHGSTALQNYAFTEARRRQHNEAFQNVLGEYVPDYPQRYGYEKE